MKRFLSSLLNKVCYHNTNSIAESLLKGKGFHDVIHPPISSSGVDLPAMILWNPYLMYAKVMAQNEPKYNQCGSYISHSYWNDGPSAAKQPRMIHGFNDIVNLVSAVFV